MNISRQIENKINGFAEDYVFTASYFKEIESAFAVTKALNRMAAANKITKLSKGKFYKPRQTQFGTLEPSPYQIAKDFIERNGKQIGYITGYSAFATMGLTTQISSQIQIGTNKYRAKVQRSGHSISFVMQPNKITKDNIALLQLLDAVKYVREIPATTPDEAIRRLIELFRELKPKNRVTLANLAMAYTNYVRAICGAIFEIIDAEPSIIKQLRKSLNGITEYRLPISEKALPTKNNWRIKQ